MAPSALVTLDYTGLNLTQLIEKFHRISFESHELLVDYNEGWEDTAEYHADYQAAKQLLDVEMNALTAALMPYYRADVAREQWERSFMAQEIFA